MDFLDLLRRGTGQEDDHTCRQQSNANEDGNVDKWGSLTEHSAIADRTESEKRSLNEPARILSIVPSELDADREPLELIASKLAVDRGGQLLFIAGKLVHIVAAMLLLGLIWAAIATVDVVAEAPGHIVPSGLLKEISPTTDGVIDELLVKEGQTVSTGTALVRLDRTPFDMQVKVRTKDLELAEAELQEHKLAVEALRSVIRDPSKIPMYKVEFSDIGQIVDKVYTSYAAHHEASRDVAHVSESSAAESAPAERISLLRRLQELRAEKEIETTALTQRRQEFTTRKEEARVKLKSTKAQLAACKDTIEKLNSILAKTKEQERAYKKITQEGAISRIEYLNVLKMAEGEEVKLIEQKSLLSNLAHQLTLDEAAQLELESKAAADLAQQEGQLRKLAEQIAAIDLQLRNGERHEVLSNADFHAALERAKGSLSQELLELDKAQRKIEQAKANLTTAQHAFCESEIKAPVDGLVTGIRVKGKGQVVNHKEHLMTIVPANSPLIVEAYVHNKDAGFLQSGQLAKIKMDAFPFQDFGFINGKVTLVESNAEEKREEKGTHEFLYRVLIAPERTWMKAGGRQVDFASGMSVTAEIVIRHRSVLSILFEPIQNLRDTNWN